MRYDLTLIGEFCREIGVPSQFTTAERLEVPVGDGAFLCFQNADQEEDCLLGFTDTPWHMHGNPMFCDREGRHIELDSLDLLSGLNEGRVLICERQIAGQIVDRWLVHSEYNDEFRYLQPGERVIARLAAFAGV